MFTIRLYCGHVPFMPNVILRCFRIHKSHLDESGNDNHPCTRMVFLLKKTTVKKTYKYRAFVSRCFCTGGIPGENDFISAYPRSTYIFV